MAMRTGAKAHWRRVDGILLLDKPAGLSSNQALQAVRRLLRAEKGGHTGSLDPLATGLLPLCFGEATKIAGVMLGAAKAYRTECVLGATTTTDDADGEVLARRPVPDVTRADLEAALAPLTGRIAQVPPAYSALKQGGEPLYRRARRGETVSVPAREVDVHRIDVIAQRGERLELEIECGSGTYVRSLVRDLGERLGCGAHVAVLRRTWVVPFHAPDMLTLEALQALGERAPADLDARLLPLEAGLAGWRRASLDADAALRLRQGQAVDAPPGLAPGPCAAFDAHGRAVALAEVGVDGRLRSTRGLNPPNA
jgi:tRNA pseudouridine55 synthase